VRKILLVVAGIAVVVAILVGLRDYGSPADPRPVVASTSGTGSTPSTSPPMYRTGTALGRPVSTDYGVVQVRVTTRGGRIVEVAAVQLPHEVPTDVELSRRAVDGLTPAVLEAQTTDVHVVTGATYTSTGYLQSLQSALDSLS
jgi:uncharacterized protein with FMN-binding domain